MKCNDKETGSDYWPTCGQWVMPPLMRNLVLWLLQREPANRPPSAAAALQHLWFVSIGILQQVDTQRAAATPAWRQQDAAVRPLLASSRPVPAFTWEGADVDEPAAAETVRDEGSSSQGPATGDDTLLTTGCGQAEVLGAITTTSSSSSSSSSEVAGADSDQEVATPAASQQLSRVCSSSSITSGTSSGDDVSSDGGADHAQALVVSTAVAGIVYNKSASIADAGKMT